MTFRADRVDRVDGLVLPGSRGVEIVAGIIEKDARRARVVSHWLVLVVMVGDGIILSRDARCRHTHRSAPRV
jgi:hypothetical protein